VLFCSLWEASALKALHGSGGECGLTPHSSRAPTARHLAVAAVQCIISRAGQAPVCRARLSSNVRRRKLHRQSTPRFSVAFLAFLSGCEGPPTDVFVLQAPQSVELAASASAQVAKVGEPLVLRATRRTRGTWTLIKSRDLAPGQCWTAAIPPLDEHEVADNVHWIATPASAAKFNTDFRPNRTREVTFSEPGNYTLSPSTGAWCEPGRVVLAEPIHLVVEKD